MLKWKNWAFNKVLYSAMFNGLPWNSTSITGDDVTLCLVFLIPGSCAINSSLKVLWEPSDEALFIYWEFKPFKLSNYFLIFNTRGKWLLTARQVGRHGKFQHISLLCTREQTLYLSHCSSYIKKIKTKKNKENKKKQKQKQNKKYIYIYGFRRFHVLLIHSLVTPKNMEISSQNDGDQPLKIQIVQKCYLSG